MPFLYGYYSYLYWVNCVGFHYFTPWTSPTISSLQWTPVQSCPPTHWLPMHYHYQTCPTYSLSSTTCYTTNFPFFVFSCYEPFLSVLMDKTFGFLTPISLPYIEWSQPSTTSFRQNVIPVKHFPKRGFSWKPKIGYFPPSTKPHPLNPLTVGPLPLYWLDTGWWCSNHCVLAPLSSVFVFFRSHVVSAVIDWYCFILLRVSFACVYLVGKRAWAFGYVLFPFLFSQAYEFAWHGSLPEQPTGLLFFFFFHFWASMAY